MEMKFDYTKLADVLSNMKTEQDVRIAHRIFKDALDHLQRTKVHAFSKGDKVYFSSRKTGGNIQGTVTKVNQKTIDVLSTTGAKWKVSPSLLHKA